MRRAWVFLLVYLLSGAAALLYEVVWLRLLSLAMGHTAAAVSTVLAVFMGGLALGAGVAGRAGPRLTSARALRVYAGLEIVVAACALALPVGVRLAQPLLAWAYAGTTGMAFEATRIGLSIFALLIPAAAMGATYPIAVTCLTEPGFGIRGSGFEGRAAGLLYAGNTIGAAFGAAVTGFLLLPWLGLFGTTLVGVALNATAALGAFLLSRTAAASSHHRTPVPSDAPSHPRTLAPSHLALSAFALSVSGFVALVYEVAWTRILAMVLGPTTYAFSAMLVAFIGGLAIGSSAAAGVAPRVARPGFWLGVAMMAAACAALIACAWVDRLPLEIAAAAGRADADFGSVFAREVGLVIALQLPMTMALGAAFPFAIALASPTRQAGSPEAGTIYASNTAGAIAGALAGSFLLIARLGLQTSVQAVSMISIVVGLLVAWRSTGRAGRAAAVVVALAATGLAGLMPRWNHERMANGAYRFAPSLAAGDIDTGLGAGRLTYYREGVAGTVSVKELLGVTSLAIDGKVDASNGSDMLTQTLLAHLPLLLHDDPRRVYVIGLGSGVTLGAALTHPIASADVAEISPEVVEASAAFERENRSALRDPRTRLVLADGRTHLQLSPQRFDVIISEPSNPWMAGVSTLFTREFFLAARDKLAPGGILCQWAHTYSISDADLRSIVATFLSAFPDGSAWLVGEGDLILIGSAAPLRSLDEGIDRAWTRPGVAAALEAAGVRDPFSVLSLFVGRGDDLRRYAGTAGVQTDDGLALEFSAPRAIYGQFERRNVENLRHLAATASQPAAVKTAYAGATSTQWRHRAQMELAADAPDVAYGDFRRALDLMPDDPDGLDGFAKAAAATGRLAEAATYLQARVAVRGSAAPFIELSKVLSAAGRAADAAVAAQQGAALEPSNARALGQLVTALADAGNEEALDQLCGLLAGAGANDLLSARCAIRLAFLRGDFAGVIQQAPRLETGAHDAEAARTLNVTGSAYAVLGDLDNARRAFEASLAIAPRDAAVLVNLGLVELQSRHSQAAADRFAQALFLYPTFAPALDGLAKAFDQMGQGQRAASIRALAPSP